jgi:hypothetical protein
LSKGGHDHNLASAKVESITRKRPVDIVSHQSLKLLILF